MLLIRSAAMKNPRAITILVVKSRANIINSNDLPGISLTILIVPLVIP